MKKLVVCAAMVLLAVMASGCLTITTVRENQGLYGGSSYQQPVENYDYSYRKVVFWNNSDYDVVFSSRSRKLILRPGQSMIIEMPLGRQRFTAYAYRCYYSPSGKRIVRQDYVGKGEFHINVTGRYETKYRGIRCGDYVSFGNYDFYKDPQEVNDITDLLPRLEIELYE